MSDHWLYSQELPAGAADWTLEGDEAQHGRAKHLEAGEAIHLFDGRGRVAAARVVECGKRALAVRIEAVEMVRPRLPRLTIAVSQPKGERLDWMLEKLTELGVAGIWPMQCERSVAHAKDDRMDRWQRRLIEAGKQAHVSWLPVLEVSQRLPQVLERAGEFGRRMVGDCGAQQKRRQGEEETRSNRRAEGAGDRGQPAPTGSRVAGRGSNGSNHGNGSKDTAQAEARTPNNDHGPATAQDHGTRGPSTSGGTPANNAGVAPGSHESSWGDTVNSARPILAAKFAPGERLLVVIGPEGGFSDMEREAMHRSGFAAVSLGPTVLRTETAAIVAAGCVLAAGDLAGLSGGADGGAP